MTDWVIVAAVCCGLNGELLFAKRAVHMDRDVCHAVAVDIQARYALQGKAALVRCRAAVE